MDIDKNDPLSKVSSMELSIRQQFELERFSRAVREADSESVQAIAIDLFRQLYLHKNFLLSQLKGELNDFRP